MEYIEVCIDGLPDGKAEILTAEMFELGFESFTAESEGSFKAYIPFSSSDLFAISDFLKNKAGSLGFTFRIEKLASQNWNEVWESAYQAVRVGNVFIRAPFHEPDPAADLDIVIEPKMSFGTAHHETTRLMIMLILQTGLENSTVLDMGTGTGVLGIIAAKRGALKVVAIDNDEWSFLNAGENAVRNNVHDIIVIHGDASDIPVAKYDCIFANINRNVLLNDMNIYHSFLADNGFLFLSGFFEEDLPLVIDSASGLGLEKVQSETLNHWAAVKFKKC